MKPRRSTWSHTLAFSLLLLLPAAISVQAQTNLPTPKVYLVRNEPRPVRASTMAEVQKIYDGWKQANPSAADVPRDVMLKMYRAGDYATIKTMIENGKISGEHSLSMADLRTAMCLETIRDICREKINGRRVRVYRSDSGNQSAGMTSDIDHTLFAYVEDEHGKWRRAPELDEHITTLFKDRFQRTHNMPHEKFDIATFPGKDKFPDSRLVSVQVDAEGKTRLAFKQQAGESMASLRLKPGAYTYCGPVVQQMQLRVLDQLQRELGSLRSNPGAPGRKMHPELKTLVGDTESRVCDAIGPTDTGEVGIRAATCEEAIDVMFDGTPPALERSHAYDAAVANFLEFSHHLHDANPAVKYHLRAADDGANILHLLEKLGAGNDTEPHKAKQQYEKLSDAERTAYLERIVGKDNPAMVERWKESFDISARMRELHNQKALSAENVDLAFKPLAEKLAPKGEASRWKQFLPQARAEYNRRCLEFQTHNIIATSKERVLLWVNNDPNDPAKRAEMDRLVDEERLRKVLHLDGAENKMKWLSQKSQIYQQYADISRLQLLYSFREMDPHISDAILANAKSKLSPTDFQGLADLRTEAKSKLFGFWRVTEYPKLYRDFAFESLKVKGADYKQRLIEHLLTESGIKDPNVEMHVREMFRLHRVPGIAGRYLHGAVFDVGNIDGVLKVLVVYSETGGDPDACLKAAVEQGINSLPIIGQVVGFYDADWKGRGLMAMCIAVPAAGAVVLIYSVGESGLALYEHEFVAPLANAASDAIYRGYIGPSLYEFGQAPPQFTESDQVRLDNLNKTPAFDQATNQSQIKQWAQMKLIQRALQRKKNAWDAFVAADRNHEGSAIAGTARQLTQKPLPAGSLLDRVEPVVFYSPKGPLDFTLKPLSTEQQRRLEALPKLIEIETDPLAKEDLIGEEETLAWQQEEVQRAERYRQRAKENPELLLQIRRDSLWPYILHDKSKDLVTPAWVRWWIDDHAQELPAQLKTLGIDVGDKIPERIISELQDRVQADIQNSRERYEHWQFSREAQAKQRRDLVERRKGALVGEALMEAARRKAAELAPFAEAVFLRSLPDSAPIVRISLRVIEGEKPGDREYRADVRVVADPGIYKPPYSAATFMLGPEQAAQAVKDRSYQGITLSDRAVQYLRGKADEVSRPVPGSDPAVLTFAFCEDFEMPQRTLSETTAAIRPPRRVNVTLPDGKTKSLCLLGYGIAAPELKSPCEILSAEPAFEWGAFKITCKYRANLSGPWDMHLIELGKGEVEKEAGFKTTDPKDGDVNTHVFSGIEGDKNGDARIFIIEITSLATGTNVLARSDEIIVQRPREGWRFESLDRTRGSDSVVRENSRHRMTLATTLKGTAVRISWKDEDRKSGEVIEKVEWIGPFPSYVKSGSKVPGGWWWVESRKSSAAPPARQLTSPDRDGYRVDIGPPMGSMSFLMIDGFTLKPDTDIQKFCRDYKLPEANPRRTAAWEYHPNEWDATVIEVAASAAEPRPETAKVFARILMGWPEEEVARFEWTYRFGTQATKPKVAAAKPIGPVAQPRNQQSSATASPQSTKSPAANSTTASSSAPPAQPRTQPATQSQPPPDIPALRAAAEKGGRDAQHQLGAAYYHGQGVPADYSTAVTWLRKAADQGSAVSQNYLGRCYEHGRGVPKGPAESFRWYSKSAASGFAAAQYNLGRLYYFGIGVSKDAREAFEWYRKAADQGHAAARNAVGTLYDNGEGTAQNYAEALKWYRLAADAGSVEANRNLGVMYAQGHGVSANAGEAVRYYRLAAEAGDAIAQDYLGGRYERGDAVPRNLEEAARWYRRAADQGLDRSQFHLASLYAVGGGVPRDLIQAHLWFNLAAAQNFPEAAQHRNDLARQLSPADLSRAQSHASQWKPR